MPVTSPHPCALNDPARSLWPARRRFALSLAAALLLVNLPACADGARTRAQPVEMSIVDRDSGQSMLLYRKDGRAYVAGQPGSRYAIRLANQTGGRVLAVVSVDGVNVVSGETAASSQSGYVLDPWQSFDITGWRKSESEVAAFEFAALSDSYAARTGRPGNVGVIGMAAFLEKPAPQVLAPRQAPPPSAAAQGSASELQRPDEARSASADSKGSSVARSAAADATAQAAAPAALAAPPAPAAAPRPSMSMMREPERLGTAHGQREWSVVTRTTFERLSSIPQGRTEIAYDSHARLVLAGVIPRSSARARAFPDDDQRGFVPDPPAR